MRGLPSGHRGQKDFLGGRGQLFSDKTFLIKTQISIFWFLFPLLKISRPRWSGNSLRMDGHTIVYRRHRCDDPTYVAPGEGKRERHPLTLSSVEIGDGPEDFAGLSDMLTILGFR